MEFWFFPITLNVSGMKYGGEGEYFKYHYYYIEFELSFFVDRLFE